MSSSVLPETWTPIAENAFDVGATRRGPDSDGLRTRRWLTLEASPLDYDQVVRLREAGVLLTALRGNILLAKKAKGR